MDYLVSCPITCPDQHHLATKTFVQTPEVGSIIEVSPEEWTTHGWVNRGFQHNAHTEINVPLIIQTVEEGRSEEGEPGIALRCEAADNAVFAMTKEYAHISSHTSGDSVYAPARHHVCVRPIPEIPVPPHCLCGQQNLIIPSPPDYWVRNCPNCGRRYFWSTASFYHEPTIMTHEIIATQLLKASNLRSYDQWEYYASKIKNAKRKGIIQVKDAWVFMHPRFRLNSIRG